MTNFSASRISRGLRPLRPHLILASPAYTAQGHTDASIKKLTVYLKPDEGKAYYVVNDAENGSIDL